MIKKILFLLLLLLPAISAYNITIDEQETYLYVNYTVDENNTLSYKFDSQSKWCWRNNYNETLCTQESYYFLLQNESDRYITDYYNDLNKTITYENATYEKITATIGNFDLITDNSPHWDHNLSRSENCLLNTNLSSSENMHETICPELTTQDDEIIINKVVRMLWYFTKKIYERQLELHSRTEELCSFNDQFSWCL